MLDINISGGNANGRPLRLRTRVRAGEQYESRPLFDKSRSVSPHRHACISPFHQIRSFRGSPLHEPQHRVCKAHLCNLMMSESSINTFGSSPTTQASCPGCMIATSPGPNSISVPSAIFTR